MGAFWVVAETRHLIDGEGDVWACVVRDVGEDADDLVVTPFHFPLEAVFVVREDGGSGVGTELAVARPVSASTLSMRDGDEDVEEADKGHSFVCQLQKARGRESLFAIENWHVTKQFEPIRIQDGWRDR